MTLKEERRKWADEHPAVKKLVDTLGARTGVQYLKTLHRYFVWLAVNGGEFKDYSPEQLVEAQINAQGRDRLKQLDLLQTWMKRFPRLRVSTKRTMYAHVKSFYVANRAELPQDKFTMRSDRPPVEGKLDVEGLKKIIEASNTAYRAVFTIMFQGGMGEAEFMYFNTQGWSEVKRQLDQDNGNIKVDQLGRKHGGSFKAKPFYSVLGRDAKTALQKYLSEQRGRVGDGEAVILNARGKPIDAVDIRNYFHSKAVRTGVTKRATPDCPKCGGETRKVLRDRWKTYYACNECGNESPAKEFPEFIKKAKSIRYGVNPHEIRDVFRSEWEVSPAKGIVAEFIMGHTIDKNEYNKFHRNVEYVISEYRKAEPFLNIMSEDPRVVSRFEVTDLRQELARYKEENERLRRSLEDRVQSSRDLEQRVKEQDEKLENLEEKHKRMERKVNQLLDKLEERDRRLYGESAETAKSPT